jgi:histidine kinase/histidine kinase/DNA gyrase B/HSP90-like ATPase
MREISAPTPPPPGHRWKTALMVVAISSVIALLFSLMEPDLGNLRQELLISNAIGVCIWLLIQGLHLLSRGRLGLVPCMLIGVPGGVILGSKTAALFGAVDIIRIWTRDPGNEWKSISITLVFSLSATAFIMVFWKAVNYRLELEGERRRSAEAGRAQAVAELGLLQAQIEPHFLFNTLAHVQSAIEEEPVAGKAMLEHLVQYLRGALSRSRVSRYTLREEVGLVDSLLAIATIRLGNRLNYRIVIPEDLLAAALPPLLLQPLVENAIKHGIEASVEGGEIRVEGEVSNELLVLRVIDSGVGIAMAAPEGVGLSNVRARLASLYGDKGRLSLLRNEPRGIVAELRLPLQHL